MPEATPTSDLIQVLQSRSLSSAVQDEIESRILSGTFRSGERINENRLAGELRISRGPIREACRGLVESGLLTVIVNRGFFVRSVSLKDAEDVYDVRASLMRLAGATLADRITPSQLECLRDLVAGMDTAQAAEDFDAFYSLNREFHDRIIDFADNDRLRALCNGLAKELHLYRSRSILQAAVTGTFGVAALAAATMGFLMRPTAAWERVTLGGAALLLLKAGWITDLMGLGLGAIVLVVHLRRNRADRAADQRIPVHS